MFSSIISAALVATLAAPQVLANLYITAPVASTTCAAGQPCQVAWNDDGTTPALGTIGACTVGLYVGSQQTQILLQNLGDVNVVQQATAVFTPDATVGGNSNLYFLRFTATNYNVGQYPYEGFSAKFTLSGMTGTFNATEQSLMTAPTAPGSSTPGASVTQSVTSSTGAGSTTSGVSTSTLTKAPSGSSTSKATTTATSSTGAASPVLSGSHAAGLVAVVVSALFAAAAF